MADPKLCEVIAVATGRKGETQKAVTEMYHKLQKGELFDGLSRTYKPRDEDGEALPGEQKSPQLRVKDLIGEASDKWAELFDVTLTLDAGNCTAKSDIVVDDVVVMAQVPVTTLLFLEKQLGDVKSFISKIPVPDPSLTWQHDANQDLLATAPIQTVRTQKKQKAIVLYDATDKHPAQTQLITEDVSAGDWTVIHYTSRISTRERNKMLDRVNKLIDAVKTARERANSIHVPKLKGGADLLKFVFGQ